MMRLLLLVLVLLALVNAQLPGKALGKKTGKSSGNGAMSKRPGSSMASAAAKRSGAQTQLGKLRSDMMKWYCASGDHSDIPPCQTFVFMSKMKAATSPDEKKKLLAARQEEMKKMSADDRKQLAMKAKTGYTTMYKEYCEKTDIPNKNPDVCTNALLKNLYGKKQ